LITHDIQPRIQKLDYNRTYQNRTYQACLRPRDRFWGIPVPKIDSVFDNLLVPQPEFVEAGKAAPTKKKDEKVSKADAAIGKIRKLYAIEKRIETLPPEEKTRQRQQLAQPVLDVP
ncbi:IS66 family transposase, partial [Thiolapillus sp.]